MPDVDSFEQHGWVRTTEQAQGLITRQFVPSVCLAVLLVSALMLSGWAVGIPLFTALYPDYESVKPNTAAAFILAASSLWLLAPLKNTVPSRLVGMGVGVLVSAIGFVTLLEYVSGLDLGIDALLFNVTPRNLADLYPARMSID